MRPFLVDGIVTVKLIDERRLTVLNTMVASSLGNGITRRDTNPLE